MNFAIAYAPAAAVVPDLDAAFDGGPVSALASKPEPIDQTRDANADVDAAFASAAARRMHALLILGANWRHDSRNLAAKFQSAELAPLIAANFELVYVDVGRRTRNLEAAFRFGVVGLRGMPVVLIVSADMELLNKDSVDDWRNAASRPLRDAVAYFAEFAR